MKFMRKVTALVTMFVVTLSAFAFLPMKEAKAATKVTYFWPVDRSSVSSEFGPRKAPLPGASTDHKGMDIPAPKGTRVNASAAGTVIEAGYNSSKGNFIRIRHDDNRVTEYLHLSKKCVKAGNSVKLGEKIGEVGSTGLSTGNHLDFRITKTDGKTFVNPRSVISTTYASTALSKITKGLNLSYSGVTLYGNGIVIASWSRPSGSLGTVVNYSFSYKLPSDRYWCTSGTTRSTKSIPIAVKKGTIFKVQANISYEGRTYTTTVSQVTVK